MFQDTADEPWMRMHWIARRKTWRGAGNYQTGITKKSIVTFAFGLFYSMPSKFFALLLYLIQNGPCAPKQKR